MSVSKREFPVRRGGIFAVACLAGLVVAAGAQSAPTETQPPAAPKAAPKPKIVLSSELWSFGEIWFGDKLENKIDIRNEGDAELRIESVRASCGCTTSKAEKSVLAPGESTTAKVTFDSHKRQGAVNTQVTIVSNDPDRRQVVYYLKGFVKRVLNYEPAGGAVMRTLDRNAVMTGTCTITATTDEPIHLKIEKVDTEKFDVTLKEVVAGQKYEMIAVSKPPFETGRTVGNVFLATGNPREPKLMLTCVATVYDKVELIPAAIFLEPSMTPERTKRSVTVHYFGEKLDFTVLNVDVPSDAFVANFGRPHPAGPEWDRLGDGKPKLMVDIQLDLPPGKSLPPEGVKLVIHTNEPGFEEVPLLVTPDGAEFNRVLRKNTR